MTKLVFGVTFVAVAAAALFSDGDIGISTAWLWAIGLGGIGLAGLVATIGAIVRTSSSSPSGPMAPPDPPA